MREAAGVFVLALWLGVLVAGIVVLRSRRLRLRARARLEAGDAEPEPEEAPPLGPFVTRYRSVSLLFAAGVALAFFLLGWKLVFVAAFATFAAVLSSIADGMRVEARLARIETQLGDAIDLMVGSLRAGAGLIESIELAAREVEAPLALELADVTGKIRFGDEPQKVFGELTERVPVDAFKLFALTISVNWEVGGSIATSLATVGRTIRDKIELNRRIRARTTQARASVLGILGVSYFVGVLMWRADPRRMEEFLSTAFGSDAVGFALVLQALGLIWMSSLSRIDRA